MTDFISYVCRVRVWLILAPVFYSLRPAEPKYDNNTMYATKNNSSFAWTLCEVTFILCMISLIFIVNFSANSMIYEMQLRHLSSVQHVKRTCIMLEYNLFKNVFNWPTFLWQTQIQTTEYSLNDTIGIKKKGVFLMIYSFTPFDINFQTILMAKVIFGKKSVKKCQKLESFFTKVRLSNEALICATQNWIYLAIAFQPKTKYKKCNVSCSSNAQPWSFLSLTL